MLHASVLRTPTITTKKCLEQKMKLEKSSLFPCKLFVIRGATVRSRDNAVFIVVEAVDTSLHAASSEL